MTKDNFYIINLKEGTVERCNTFDCAIDYIQEQLSDSLVLELKDFYMVRGISFELSQKVVAEENLIVD
jgi:hypothetical protein